MVRAVARACLRMFPNHRMRRTRSSPDIIICSTYDESMVCFARHALSLLHYTEVLWLTALHARAAAPSHRSVFCQAMEGQVLNDALTPVNNGLEGSL